MVRTRIAPSPTGQDLHIGNAYTALINYLIAKKEKGKFIIRIEDTDRTRFVVGAEKRILDSFSWLTLTADESPLVGGPYGPYRQSERKKLYKEYARKLVEKGQAYPCFCPVERLRELRQKQQQAGKPSMYDGLCKKLSDKEVSARIAKGEKHVIRLNVPDRGETCLDDLVRGRICFQNKLIDDQVLLKSDGFPTYHLAVVVDDHLMEISHVIRAEDWLSSTPKHLLLYRAFGWTLPVFAHLPLLRNPDKSKLSKRKNPVWLHWYKEQGFLPEAINNYLLTLGWSHPEEKSVFSLAEAIEKFTFDRVGKSAPVFDLVKLQWLNGEYLRQMSDAKLGEKLTCFYRGRYTPELIRQITPLVRERVKTLIEVDGLIDFFEKEPAVEVELLVPKKRNPAEAKKVLTLVLDGFDKLEKWEVNTLHDLGNRLVGETGWKPVELFQMIRIAVSGKTVTPPLFESLVVLGREKTCSRIKKAVGKL